MSELPDRCPAFCPPGAWEYIVYAFDARHSGTDLLVRLLEDGPDIQRLWASLRRKGVKDDDWRSWRALLSYFMYCEPGAGFDPRLQDALNGVKRDLRKIADSAFGLSKLLDRVKHKALDHGIELPRPVDDLYELMRPRWSLPEPVRVEYGFRELRLSDLLLDLADSAANDDVGLMTATQRYATTGYGKLVRTWVWHFDAGFERHVIPHIEPKKVRLGHADLARLARVTLSPWLGPDDDITDDAVRKARDEAPREIEGPAG